MRSLIFAAVVSLASVAYGQYPSGVWVAGPFQPSPYGGYYYFNPSAPQYRGPVGYGPSYYGGDYETAREIRRLRWAVEDEAFDRRWRRR